MTPEELQVLSELCDMHEARPSLRYMAGRKFDLDGKPVDPLDNGQLQFHKAPHVFRLLAPGNGFGKTAALAVETDLWGFGDHPYQSDLPKRPRQQIWTAPTYKQWELIRGKIENWWPDSVRNSWVGQPKFSYTWPDSSTLSIITAETDWRDVQGFEPDRINVDEGCPASLWHELLKRRRGNTRTRFDIAATQTDGLTWMYYELYKLWKEYHEAKGITEEREMMRRQLHRFSGDGLEHLPGIWCWPTGGHRDNPTATKETWAFYLATTKGHPAERAVRLYGGFRDFAGVPVFDPEALEAMRATLCKGRTGELEKVET